MDDAALRDSVATGADVEGVRREVEDVRRDVEDVRRELRAVEQRLEAKIETAMANLKVEILRWLVVTQVALAGFLFAALKLVR
jgi:phage-related minor tail protein